MKLSVCLITYNHEKYIAHALESVLAQKTDFRFEVVVGEDCSTDRTGAIVSEYARRYPDVVRVLAAPSNLGLKGKRNFLRTLAACTGEYVALLEGDDYWTDPDKLRRQVALLEAHPGAPFCFHPARHEDGKGRVLATFPEPREGAFTPDDLLRQNFVPTCSSVFRRALFSGFPEWVPEDVSGDWLVHLLLALHGPFLMHPNTMAAYRVHGTGAWSSLGVIDQLNGVVRMIRLLRAHYPKRYRPLLTERLARQQFELAWLCAERSDGDREEERRVYKALRGDPELWAALPRAARVALRLKLGHPLLYRAAALARKVLFQLRARVTPTRVRQ
jgi:glycosyltransferase involved in cell wall biosynthesis